MPPSKCACCLLQHCLPVRTLPLAEVINPLRSIESKKKVKVQPLTHAHISSLAGCERTLLDAGWLRGEGKNKTKHTNTTTHARNWKRLAAWLMRWDEGNDETRHQQPQQPQQEQLRKTSKGNDLGPAAAGGRYREARSKKRPKNCVRWVELKEKEKKRGNKSIVELGNLYELGTHSKNEQKRKSKTASNENRKKGSTKKERSNCPK